MNIGVLQLSIVFFIVGGLLMLVFKKLKIVISANGKKGIFYLLAVVLLFAVVGFLTMESLFSGNMLFTFILVQLVFLLLGILHLLAMGAFLKWEKDFESTSQFIFTFVAAIFGSIGFINAAAYFGIPGFHLFFLSGIVSFFVPLFFKYLWLSLVAFPVPVYQKWYYPVSRNITLPDRDELRNLRIISLEFEKTPGSDKTIFKAKAPINMNFGTFFYHFINDYNQSAPEAPIAIKDEQNQAFGWSFYVKPNFVGSTRNVNPELTLQTNRIKEHSTIICQRVV